MPPAGRQWLLARGAERHHLPAGVDGGGQPPRREFDVQLGNQRSSDVVGMQRRALTEVGADSGERIVGPPQALQRDGVKRGGATAEIVLVDGEQVERVLETRERFVIGATLLMEHPRELLLELAASDREKGRADA